MKRHSWVFVGMTVVGGFGEASAEISVVPYGSVGPNLVDFEDVAGAPFPGVHYEGILASGGVTLAERFAGQTLSFDGDLDVLSGTPTDPLTLLAGASGQNLAVGTDTGTNGLYPYGPRGFPDSSGYGEGAFAVLFPAPVSEFGLQSFFSDAGSNIFFQFFRSDGSSIEALSVLTTGGPDSYGFRRDGDVRDIAGVSVHTSDPGGLGYDNLVYGVPAPATLAVLGLAGLRGSRRRRLVNQ